MIEIPNILLQEKPSSIPQKEHKQHDKELQDITLLDNTLVSMPNGLLGFEEFTEYMFTLVDEGIVYRMFGVVDDSPLFLLINPYLVVSHYTLSIEEEEYELLKKPDFNKLLVLAIITLKEKMEKATCNLLGPVVINCEEKIGLQVVNMNGDWSTQHLLSNGKKIVPNTS